MFKKTKLENGLRVIMAPQAGATTATVLVLVEAGSKYETKDINGISHFLEHMCFKGTDKRARQIDIATELEGLGSEYNAFTGQEYTGYYAKARSEKLPQIFDVVADMYLNPTFPKEEIETERGVIIEEINMYEDLPQRRVQEMFSELLYGDQPAGWDIAGEKEVIRKLRRQDFIDYRSKHYLAEATLVAVAGNFDEKKVLEQIRENFDGMPTGGKQGKKAVVEEQSEPKIMIREKKSDQTHLVLGVRAFPATDERRYALEVLADVLGGGISSRLFQNVRSRLGAAYYVRAATDLMTDTGSFIARAGIDHKKLEAVVEAIISEFKGIAETQVSEKELEKSKEHLAGNLAMSLEGTDEQALFYGMQEIERGEIEEIEEMIKKIKAVTGAQVQQVAKDIFKNEGLNLAIIGPFNQEKEEEKLKEILKF